MWPKQANASYVYSTVLKILADDREIIDFQLVAEDGQIFTSKLQRHTVCIEWNTHVSNILGSHLSACMLCIYTTSKPCPDTLIQYPYIWNKHPRILLRYIIVILSLNYRFILRSIAEISKFHTKRVQNIWSDSIAKVIEWYLHITVDDIGYSTFWSKESTKQKA